MFSAYENRKLRNYGNCESRRNEKDWEQGRRTFFCILTPLVFKKSIYGKCANILKFNKVAW